MHLLVSLQGSVRGVSLATLVTLKWSKVVLLTEVPDIVPLKLDDVSTFMAFVTIQDNYVL